MTTGKRLQQFSVWKSLFQQAYKKLINKNPLLLAGATAFFAAFSSAPVLLLLVQFIGLLIGQQDTRAIVAQKLAQVVGSRTKEQMLHTLSALHQKADNPLVIAVGFLVLLFLSTNVFQVINTSLNSLWMVRVSQNISFWEKLKLRLRYILLIVVAGFLVMIGLLGEVVKNFLGNKLSDLLPFLSFYFHGVLHYLLSLVINGLWFAVVFRYLPDVRPSWNTVAAGSILTAVLFILGRLLLHTLLLNGGITTLYGASAAIVLLLLFVFYSSLIMYFGAAFTVVWAHTFEHKVRAMPYAHFYFIEERHSTKPHHQ